MSHPKHPLLLGAALTGAALTLPGFYTGLKLRRYTLAAPALTAPLRLALISDFHACDYGPEASRLTTAIHKAAPDLILMTGDIFDFRQNRQNTEALLRALAGKYPSYYVTGNHEYRNQGRALPGDMALLKRCGVTRLSGERINVTIGTQTLTICGVDDPDSIRAKAAASRQGRPCRTFYQQLSTLRELPPTGNYTILLSHRPEHFPLYACPAFDLVLCGHAHGGQWRIPGLLNGLYAPNQGLFPPYAGGEYHKGTTTMIVSRGLARENTRVPRFYDPPELVIIDLKGRS